MPITATMTLSSRLRHLTIALLPLALATACLSGSPTVPPATALAAAAAGTATALALLNVTPATPEAVLSTPSAPPADTPAPTATAAAVEPSATPSPLPLQASATPAGPATPDPNEAVGDIVFQDALDGSGRWFWNYADDVAVFGIDAERAQLKGVMLQAGAGWRFTSSDDTQSFSAQQVRVTTHTTACAENDEYGLMFWGQPAADAASPSPYDMYLFALRCGGAARFELIQGTQVTVLTDWTPAPAIHTGAPADNTLMVWMAGGEFRFYVNDQYLFSAQDTTLTGGFYGLYLNDRTAGGETVFFEDLIARAVNR